MKRRLVSLLLAGAVFFHANANAVTYTPADDLPNPPSHLETIPAGSLVIPMDNTLQNIVAPFNVKAYGLANKLLQSGIPLKWAISATKVKDGIDFSGTAKRIFPTTAAAAPLSFKAGPFIVHRDFANIARTAITAFNTSYPGNNVAVYETTAATTADVRYDLKFKPQIGISTTNSSIHTALLDFARIPNYLVVADTTILGSSCYTIFTQPHTTSTAGIPGVLAYVQAGGNLLCECKAIDTYENITTTHFQTTLGYDIANVNTVLTYPNAPLAYSQFDGVLDPNPGGSEMDWNLKTGSVFQNDGHIHAQNSGTDTNKYAATASKLSNGEGGLVFYLGGHNFGAGGSDVTLINGQRMILNTLFHPTAKFAACNQDFSAAIKTIGGIISQDVNGDGLLADGVVRPNVNVRLYQDANNNGLVDAGDTLISEAVTDVAGAYSFTVSTDLSGNNYLVTVDSKSVTPTAGLRAGFTPGDVWAEQTYGDDPSTVALDLGPRFGGRNGAASDNFNTADTTPANNAYQHVARVNVTTINVAGVDFGFSFNAVTSIRAGDGTDDDTSANRTVQGSLRQFLQNANAINGANAMRFTPAVAANAGTWWRIGVTVALPALNDASTTIDGQAYSNSNGTTVVDPNAGTLGTGGTVGVGAVALATINNPELEIQNLRSTAVVNVGLDVQAASAAIRRLAIFGFGSAGNSDTSANIRLGASGTGAVLEQNVIGAAANAFADPGATTRSAGDNVRVVGSATATVQNNAIGFSAGNGVALSGSSTGAQIQGNEIRGNGLGNPLLAGFSVSSGSAGTFQANLFAANAGAGLEVANGAGASSVLNNTATGNGVGSGGVTAGIRLLGASTTVDRNIVTTNAGSGILIPATGAQNTLTKNSIFQNSAIGIDLLGASANQTAGTAPFVTPNDSGDGDSGGNGLLNFPIISDATATGGNLILHGFAAPGATIELFIADVDPSNFGEGKTYTITLTEGSAQDTDNTTGSYTNPVNGLNQGADTTNRFTFTIPTPSGIAVGTVLTATATLAGATSEFSGNLTVAGPPTGLISGFVYEDANLNLFRDTAEAGTGLTLYVKIIDTATPTGPALAAAVVDPVTGGYTTNSLSPGNYTLILDDNNTLSDVTSTLPPGWTATESSGGVRTPVPVASIPVPNQNFGLYHGILVSGRVFTDTGVGGGIANDGTLNGGEAGIAGVVLKLTDATGATVHSTATTNGAGDYALALPSTIAAGTALKITETNSFASTGATVGNTAGTYNRATDTISFSVVANTTYTNVNFGDVPPNTLSTDGQQAGLPGSTIYYPHTFTAGTAGSVAFSAANVPTPPLAGWTSTLYRDINGNGQFDAGEPAITGPLTVASGESVFLMVKVAIPTTAPFGANHIATLNANFTYTGASPALTAALARKDVTTVGNPTTAGLRLAKTVDKPSALPGENITYTITYTNVSSDALRNVIIYDATPAFTKFVNGSNGPLPLDLTGVVLTAPNPAVAGAMRWTFVGMLSPGGTGTVSFVVKLDQ